MAELNSFLTSIADAIRSKKGTTEKINASNFASEIEKIQTGIEPTGTLDITENGVHNVREYENVNVDVKGGITLNPVTNIALSDNGLLSWNAPNTSEIEDKLVSISYVINLNGTELTSDTNSISVSDYLISGENIVSIKAIIGLYNEEIQSVVEYVAEIEVIILDAKLKEADSSTSAVLVGTNVYVFGGYWNSTRIQKFDTITETIITLSAKLPNPKIDASAVLIGTNVYLFGCKFGYNERNDVVKIDTISETATTLETTLPNGVGESSAVSIGNIAYIFGDGTNILKFDETTLTCTILETQFPSTARFPCAVLIGTNVYVVAGAEVYKFDTVNETISKLELQLPISIIGTGVVAVGTNIYTFGTDYSPRKNTILKIDTISETAITLGATLPTERALLSAVAVGNTAYIFGGADDTDQILKVTNL